MGLLQEANFQCVRTLSGHRTAVSSVKFEPSRGELLLSGSADRRVRLWRHETGDLVCALKQHEGGLNDVCWIGRGRQFCTASDDKTIGIWDSESQRLLHRCQGHGHYVLSVKSNGRGDTLVTGSFDETVRVWDVRSGDCVREIPAHGDPVTSVDLSPDDSSIVSGSFDGLCRVWNIADGHATRTIANEDCAPISNVQFTPNGRFLLIAMLNGCIALKRYISNGSERKEVMREYIGHKNRHICLVPAFTYAEGSGGQRWLVCGSEDHSICVWNVSKPKRRGEQMSDEPCAQRITGRENGDAEGDGHCDAVLCVHAHPLLPLIATAGSTQDATIKLWNDVLN